MTDNPSKVVKSAKPPNAGKGRVKGVPNKMTKALKEMILQALNEAHEDGGIEYLKEQAGKNPAAFLTLVGKVLPLTLAGDSDNPVQQRVLLEFVKTDAGGQDKAS